MRLGLLSDIHGNRIALEAVLDDMPPVDGLVCAGDVVGYNPWPAECVATVRERAIPTVRGNHDRAVAAGSAAGFNAMARAGVDHARSALDDDAIAWLDGLPERRAVADGRVAVVHGHPDDPDHYTRRREFAGGLIDSAADRLGVAEADLDALVLGHTHVQHHGVFPEGVVVNPGSVGQPRDGDPRAAYAVVDLDDRTVEERRVEYDTDAVAAAVADAGLPERIGSRLAEGR
ncbi:metallophosphoesterase family protein [Halobaculum gomorrense]|uniref:Phosphoesterase, MJ0936 family n=1 Tax=Halobaculum gomorrense TaxID=43928 RepID=A0A1M5SUU5_9EURY|nr:metallophosphoesterase family protein [Halobaculum gomorrense]SHH42331.1 phosphoesterase, MJ0936 family [Halobaculum gomorrense]